MIIKNDIRIPQSLQSYGTADFENIFIDELMQQESELPLQNFCSQGGWPDGESLQLRILSVSGQNGEIEISVQCFFKELVPTGCADFKISDTGQGVLSVVLDLEEQRAYLPIDTDDL